MALCDSQRRPRYAGPKYSQVCDAIRKLIIAREWPPGRPFPNETELARDYGVSVGTMRRALSLLEDERLIIRQQGRGTFVAEPLAPDDSLPLSQLHIGGKKLEAEVSLTGAAIGAASAEEAGRLLIGEDEDVIRLSRCHSNRGTVAVRELLIVPAARFPGLDNETDPSTPTLFAIYHRKYGVLVSSVNESVFVGELTDAPGACGLADAAPGPHLCVSRLAFDKNETPVEWAILHVLVRDAQLVVPRRSASR